ncbi:MAG TPA: NAD-binding protein [Candidatus Sulfotelmatobacter sp.]|nr:NAD-binding protein [Candidatus Sulfotelmatobacter sp.]
MSKKTRNLPGPRQILALWPHVPLAGVLALIGLLNILDGLSVPVTAFGQVETLTGANSLSALGGTAQIILGAMLALVGIGLLRRLVSAWTLSVSLLFVTVAVNVAQKNWGVSLFLQAVLLCVLFWTKRYFTRRTIIAGILFSTGGIMGVMAYGTIGTYLLRDGFKPPVRDWTTAFYYTIVTLSTVGYGDIVPVTREARWFAISLLVVGLGVFASAIATAIGPKISGELNRLFNPTLRAMDLKNHIILVGDGIIARNTADELRRRGAIFVQIVSKKEGTDPSPHILEGDATDDTLLRKACIQRARLVIAAREDDGENAFIALGAKDINPEVRVLAVASSPLSMRRLKLARADLVFSPAAVGGRLLADLGEGGQISAQFQDLLEGHPKMA